MELSQIFKAVLSLSAMGAVVALLIVAIKAVFKNVLDARWHYYIWFLLLVRLIIPYGPESSFSIFNLFEPAYQRIERDMYVETEPAVPTNTQQSVMDSDTYGTVTDSYPLQDVPPVTAGETAPAQVKEFTFGYRTFGYREAGIIWMIGAVIMGLYICAVNMRLFLRINRQAQCKESETIRILEECKAKLKIGTYIPIVYDTSRKPPWLFGFFRPKLVVSTVTMEKLSPEEKRYIFLHELSHLKNRTMPF